MLADDDEIDKSADQSSSLTRLIEVWLKSVAPSSLQKTVAVFTPEICLIIAFKVTVEFALASPKG